jgi:hypothetical protein
MSTKPDDLNILIKIPDEDIRSGRHDMAECCFGNLLEPCHNPVAYCMTVTDWPSGYTTDFWCEEHKPS